MTYRIRILDGPFIGAEFRVPYHMYLSPFHLSIEKRDREEITSASYSFFLTGPDGIPQLKEDKKFSRGISKMEDYEKDNPFEMMPIDCSPTECLECGKEIEEGTVYCSDCEEYLDKQGFFEI